MEAYISYEDFVYERESTTYTNCTIKRDFGPCKCGQKYDSIEVFDSLFKKDHLHIKLTQKLSDEYDTLRKYNVNIPYVFILGKDIKTPIKN